MKIALSFKVFRSGYGNVKSSHFLLYFFTHDFGLIKNNWRSIPFFEAVGILNTKWQMVGLFIISPDV